MSASGRQFGGITACSGQSGDVIGCGRESGDVTGCVTQSTETLSTSSTSVGERTTLLGVIDVFDCLPECDDDDDPGQK